MMNVSEYASDVNKEVKEILSLCKRLDINVNSEEDMLSDDDIIMLDNEIANMDNAEEELEEVEQSEEIPDEKLIDLALQYPALTPSLGTRLISIIENQTPKIFKIITESLLERVDDFWLVISTSQQQFPLLIALMKKSAISFMIGISIVSS